MDDGSAGGRTAQEVGIGGVAGMPDDGSGTGGR